MSWLVQILGCAAFLTVANSLIVPDEVPTLLSLIYSNIPTLMKGTDSRLGWGFRLGDRADFQVLVELGPQKNTQPLGNQPGGGSNKRHTHNNLVNTLYAQRQKQKNEVSNTEGGKFLDQWSKDMSSSEINDAQAPTRINLGVGEVDARDVIPDDAMVTLEQLYGKKASTTQKPITTTSAKDALDNVDLD